MLGIDQNSRSKLAPNGARYRFTSSLARHAMAKEQHAPAGFDELLQDLNRTLGPRLRCDRRCIHHDDHVVLLGGSQVSSTRLPPRTSAPAAVSLRTAGMFMRSQ